MPLLEESAVRERAYTIWEQEGRPDGRAWDHWERALREIIGSDPVSPVSYPAREEKGAAKPKRTRGDLAAKGGRKSPRRSTA